MRSAILTWHSLDDSGSVISTSPSVFKRQIEALARSGLAVAPLDRVRNSPGSVALTFDDGCRNLAEHAFPLLDRFQLPATVFVVSRYCGLSNRWPGQPASIPDLPLLDWRELAARPRAVEIGAHTATHPHLTQLSDTESDRELRESKEEIEQRLAVPVRSLAYPYGDCSEAVRRAAGRHFDLAAGTSLQFLSSASDPLDLPRIDMYYFRGGLPLERLFSSTTGVYIALRSAARKIRGLLAG